MQAQLERSRHCEDPRTAIRGDEAIQRSVGRPAAPGLLPPGLFDPGVARNDGSGLRLAGALALTLVAAAPAHANTAYVTNEKGNSVSIIDTATMETTKTVKVGQRPRGLALSKGDAFLFVCLGDDDTIQILDTKTLQIIGELPSGPDPEQLRLSPDGATLFVANENDALLTAIDVASRKAISETPVGVEPEGVAVSPDGKTVVVTSETTSMAHFIDWPGDKSVANILVPSRPRFAEFKPDGSEVWVSSEVGGKVTVIDPVKKTVVQTIAFDVPGLRPEAIQPVGIRFTSDGKLGFVALGPANRVAAIDAATKRVLKYILVGQRVWHLALTPDDKQLYTTNGVTNDVTVIDVPSLKALKSIPVGSYPWGVAITRR